MAGLGCGLGSIVLGVIVLLTWGGCCIYDMYKGVSLKEKCCTQDVLGRYNGDTKEMVSLLHPCAKEKFQFSEKKKVTCEALFKLVFEFIGDFGEVEGLWPIVLKGRATVHNNCRAQC